MVECGGGPFARKTAESGGDNLAGVVGGMFASRISRWGPNSACDVGLPLELTSSLGRDRGESGGLRGVLVAPARHRVKLG